MRLGDQRKQRRKQKKFRRGTLYEQVKTSPTLDMLTFMWRRCTSVLGITAAGNRRQQELGTSMRKQGLAMEWKVRVWRNMRWAKLTNGVHG